MAKFAKLFDDEKCGQIVVLLGTNDDDEPCVKFLAQPPGLSVCTISLSFKDEAQAQEAFDGIQIEQAVISARGMWRFAADSEAAS